MGMVQPWLAGSKTNEKPPTTKRGCDEGTSRAKRRAQAVWLEWRRRSPGGLAQCF